MTYGRVRFAAHIYRPMGAAVSHLAELVRGEFLSSQGPLIRPFGPPSPQGEKGRCGARRSSDATAEPSQTISSAFT
jgi:hypothetical protein